jgi:hypothetical protein
MSEPINVIQHYRTNVHGRIPSITSLSAGMLSVNYYDGKIFTLQERDNQQEVIEFLTTKYQPYSLILNTSSVNVNYDTNIVTGYYSNINGGYGNRVSGSGSAVIGGENNNIDSDLSTVAGINNDTKGYDNTILLGTSLSATQANTTYVNNLSSQGKLYGTLLDWMTLVRGYKTTPSFIKNITGGSVYSYVYNSSPFNKIYYRYIATDGSEDSFYTTFVNDVLSGLVASKSIVL